MAVPEGDFIKAVVPSDSAVLRGISYLLVVGAGDLAIRGLNNDPITPFPVVAGQHLRFTDGKVMATGTTAVVIAFS